MCIYVSAMMDLRLANNTVAIPVLSLSLYIYIMVILGLYDILLQGYNGNIPFMPFLKWVQ